MRITAHYRDIYFNTNHASVQVYFCTFSVILCLFFCLFSPVFRLHAQKSDQKPYCRINHRQYGFVFSRANSVCSKATMHIYHTAYNCIALSRCKSTASITLFRKIRQIPQNIRNLLSLFVNRSNVLLLIYPSKAIYNSNTSKNICTLLRVSISTGGIQPYACL